MYSSENNKVIIAGDGSTTAFAFNFSINDKTDLKVLLVDSTGAETLQVITTNYTVTGTGNSAGNTDYTSGTVTFGTAPSSSYKVVIVRDLALTQPDNYEENTDLPEVTLEKSLDKLSYKDLQQQEQLDRSLKVKITESTLTDTTIKGTATANYIIQVNDDGDGLEFVENSGGSGGGAVDSVNGATGTVVLDADDIDDTSTTNKFTTASDISKLAGIEASADVTDATNVNAAGAVMNSDTSTAAMSFVVDEDDMSSDSATLVPTQQSVKAYVDANAGGAVDSVNGQTGNVVLDPDDLDDTSTTNKFTTSSDISKLAGIEASADVTDATNVNSSITGYTYTDIGTPASGDLILLKDVSDSNNIKVAQFSTFGGAGSGDAWSDPVDSNIVPDGDNTRSLGSSTNAFDTLYIDDVYTDGAIFMSGNIYYRSDTSNYYAISGAHTFILSSASKMDITTSGVRIGGANARVTTIYDQDDMSSNSAAALCTQQSIKAYADTKMDLSTAQEVTATKNFNMTTITSTAASVAWNLAANQVTQHTLTENTTLAAPSNQVAGATYILIVVQHASSAKTLAFNSAYKFPGGVAPTVSTGASAVDVLTFVSDGTNMYGSYMQDVK